MKKHKLYTKIFNDEHPVPAPYTTWRHFAWFDSESGTVVHEHINAGDSAVDVPYPGVIEHTMLGSNEEGLTAQGFQYQGEW